MADYPSVLIKFDYLLGFSNIESKSKEFLPFIGVPMYTEKIEEVASNEYEGFTVDTAN